MVFAHGIVGRADLPIPGALFGAAAAIVLVVSFVTLAAGWTRPRLERLSARPWLRLPLAADVALGTVGVVVFAACIYAGLAGTDVRSENLAPALVYIVFWVGVPVASLVVGDVFRLLSPWRAVGRAAGALAARAGGGGTGEPLPYPERLGRWPAVAGLVAFAICELCWTQGRDPQVLAVCALVYFAVQLAGMGLYGVEAWSRHGDGFGIYFSLFASLSPVARRADRRLVLRPPLVGAVGLERPAGTVALLWVALGSTTFDGFTEGPLFSSVVPSVQAAFTALGLSLGAALEWAFVVGLTACVATVAVLYRLGAAGALRAYAHTLVPIVAAYVVAHYFSLLAYDGQTLWWLAQDPLGDPGDRIATAGGSIDYTVVSATGIWYVQIVALVTGHVAALVLAHDRALALHASAREAVRSQVKMLGLMVGFTSLGLWLLSVSNA